MKLHFLLFYSKSFQSRANVCVESISKYHKGNCDITHVYLFDNTNNKSYIDGLPKNRLETVLTMLEEGEDNIVLIGADCVFYSSILSDIEFWLQDHDVLLTPHVLKPLPDDNLNPNMRGVYQTGHANADFIVFKNTDNTKNILRWLISCDMKNDISNGIFYEQTWLSALPFIFDRVGIIRHEGYNVAYFNYHENRSLDNLRFIQYSGYDKGSPEKMSRHQNRFVAEGKMLDYYKQYDNLITE